MAAWKLQWKRWRRKPTEQQTEDTVSHRFDLQGHQSTSSPSTAHNEESSTASTSKLTPVPSTRPLMTLQYKFIQSFVKTGRIQYEKHLRSKFCSMVRQPRGSLSTLLDHCDKMNLNKQFLTWSYDPDLCTPSPLQKLYKLLIQLAVEIFYVFETQLTNIHTPCPKKVDPFQSSPSQELRQKLGAVQLVAEFTAKKCFEKFTNPKYQNLSAALILHEALTSIWSSEYCTSTKEALSGKKVKIHWVVGKSPSVEEKEVYAADIIREPIPAYYKKNLEDGSEVFRVKGKGKEVRELEPKYQYRHLTNLLRKPFELEWDQISLGSGGDWTNVKSAFKLDEYNDSGEVEKLKGFVWRNLKDDVRNMEMEVGRDPLFTEVKFLQEDYELRVKEVKEMRKQANENPAAAVQESENQGGSEGVSETLEKKEVPAKS